jgi:TIR domain
VTGHDVFLSFAGPQRGTARRIRDVLEQRHLRVWLDESLPSAASITAGIEEHLNASRIMLVLYSASYPLRLACQFELTAAFLAAQREGDPLHRIMVINPEPSEHHIQPIQLADAKFARLPKPGDGQAVTALARRVQDTFP